MRAVIGYITRVKYPQVEEEWVGGLIHIKSWLLKGQAHILKSIHKYLNLILKCKIKVSQGRIHKEDD